MISTLEKLIGTPRDGALLRYSLGLEYAKAGRHADAVAQLREAVSRDPLYSAAWKMLGKSLAETEALEEALDAYQRGIDAAQRKGDRQAEKEMTVFARRLAREIDKRRLRPGTG
ncbi:MAG TPA: tetratricopeptide repeat protein [Burkholderiales bacterium]|nr:tetratricopeptide repeat protein [Burkholderiales bacterium]